jgi:hypothetical protein
VRQQLRVDVQLADAPRDELGELAAEVEDDDGRAVVRIRRGGPILGRTLRGRRLERRLQVGLDLGVVGGEDPVAGVRLLTVDRLATVPGFAGRLRRRQMSPSVSFRAVYPGRSGEGGRGWRTGRRRGAAAQVLRIASAAISK